MLFSGLIEPRSELPGAYQQRALQQNLRLRSWFQNLEDVKQCWIRGCGTGRDTRGRCGVFAVTLITAIGKTVGRVCSD
jgi:hypothetical protein